MFLPLAGGEEPETTEDAEKREPVADGASDAEEPTEEGAGEEGVKMDIPPMPGSSFY